MEGIHTGVLDRIVDGRVAVLLLEEDGDAVGQLDVAVEELPEAGRHEGAVFDVTVEGGEFVDATYRPEDARERRRRARERFDRLSERLGGDEES